VPVPPELAIMLDHVHDLRRAQLSTTVIYVEAVGKEERDIAARMWG
jgi:hypothetical protein